MDRIKSKSWEIIHHQDQNVVEFILTNEEEGQDIFWCTYEEAAELKALLTEIPVLA